MQIWQKVAFTLIGILTALIGAILFNFENRIAENRSLISEVNERLSATEASVGLLSANPISFDEIQPTEITDEIFESNGKRFKILMSTKKERVGGTGTGPADVTSTFSKSKNKYAYLFLFFVDQIGDHSFRVEWITPQRQLHHQFWHQFSAKKDDWRAWHSIRLRKDMPIGRWYVRVYADEELISTKQFTVKP